MKKLFIFSMFAAMTASAATRIFTGAVSNKYSVPENWEGGILPADDGSDDVIFNSQTETTVSIDVPNCIFKSFTYSGIVSTSSGGNYAVVGGNGFTVLGDITINSSRVTLNGTGSVVLPEGDHHLICNGGRLDIGNGAPGFSGPGKLILDKGQFVPYGNSSFTGGFLCKAGAEVLLFCNAGMGAGDAVFEQGAKLTMYSANLTGVSNPTITLNGELNNAGNIIMSADGRIASDVILNNQPRIKGAHTLRFGGKVTCSGGGLFVTNLGDATYKSEIVFEDVFDGASRQFWMDGGGSVVRFLASSNKFSSVRLSAGEVHFDAPDSCCHSATISMYSGTKKNLIYVEGEQTVGRVVMATDTGTNHGITSATGGSLTILAPQSDNYNGSIEGKAGLIWAPKANYNFNLTGALTFEGKLVVSNGSVTVTGAGSSITQMSELRLLNSAALYMNDGATLHERLDTLELSPTATLSVNEQTDFVVDHFIVDGVAQAEKQLYTHENLEILPENVTVYVNVQPGPATSMAVWNGNGGPSTGFNVSANWQENVVPELWEKMGVKVTGGTYMTLAGDDVTLNGFDFAQSGGFTINGTGALNLYWGGIKTAAAAAYFQVPVKLAGDQTWSLGKDVVFSASVSDFDEERPATVIKTGAGAVYVEAANTFAGDLVVSNGAFYCNAAGGLGDSTVYVRRASDSSTAPAVKLCAGKYENDFYFSGPDGGHYPLRTADSGVVELAGKVTISDNQNKRFQSNGECEMRFTGGVEGPTAMFYIQGYGKYTITNTPMNVNILYSDVRADLTIAVPGNKIANSISWMNTGSKMHIACDNPFEKAVQLNLKNGASIDLDGHDVSFSTVVGSIDAAHADTVVTSATAANFMVAQNSDQNLKTRFEGGVSLIKSGSKVLYLYGMSSSTGVVQSTQSTLAIQNGGGWTNGTVRVSKSNAAVLFYDGAKLGKHTNVELSNGGRLTMSNGSQEVTCGVLWLDGQRAELGTWGATASSAKHKSDTYFISSPGVLRVLGDGNGTVIHLR